MSAIDLPSVRRRRKSRTEDGTRKSLQVRTLQIAKTTYSSRWPWVEDVFQLWWDFRQRQVSRAELQTGLGPVIQDLQAALERGRDCADGKAATFCTNVLALYPALWLFATVEGVEPTNNHIERIRRSGVLWRKNAFGSHSEGGCRFAERIMTVVQTLRLQNRHVVDYLHQALVAHRSGQPAPKLLMTTGD